MDYSKELLEFIKKSPSSFHSIQSIKEILTSDGFEELDETKIFSLSKGKKYFVTRNQSSIIAFKIGEKLDKYSFNMVFSHSDCPSFKVKPLPSMDGKNYTKINVEGYGGMICSSWFDRPLSLAGRVMIKKDDTLQSKLINFDRNLLTIPNVAIHMNRNINSGYSYNLAVDMMPTISEDKIDLYELIAEELKVKKEEISLFDLYLYNHQEGYFWGIKNEYISSPKLDDLQCAYTTLKGFIKGNNKNTISIYACFDNEEVGSTTRQGANSTFLEDILYRISNSLGFSKEEHMCALSSSFAISADNAHAVHPNHPELSDPLNNVFMNKGIVIKNNAAQTYTSDSFSSSIFMKICDKINVPYQFFNNRSDIRGGGTLGNISCIHASIPTVDIGLAQLAMHSCNETAGALDNEYMVRAIEEFFNLKIQIDANGNVSFVK